VCAGDNIPDSIFLGSRIFFGGEKSFAVAVTVQPDLSSALGADAQGGRRLYGLKDGRHMTNNSIPY
jgi:hypothetical protein